MSWKEDVQAAIAREGSINKVAQKIGISRPALSLLLAGKYPSKNTNKIMRKVTLWLGNGTLQCPHLQKLISEGDCRDYATRQQPSGDPAALRHWVACQDCELGKLLLTRPAPADCAGSAE
jgi:hypothetical protein